MTEKGEAEVKKCICLELFSLRNYHFIADGMQVILSRLITVYTGYDDDNLYPLKASVCPVEMLLLLLSSLSTPKPQRPAQRHI